MQISLVQLIQKTQNLKVLYVEDNDEARNQTKKTLDNFFEYIDIAVDGVDGLEKYQQKEIGFYDLVISDISMPRLNGDDMVKEILALNNIQPVLMITAHNHPEQLEKLIAIGISCYIHKPVNLETLLIELNKIVELIENRKEKEQEFNKIQQLNHELDSLIDSFDIFVIASRTDLKGNITYASKAYETISGYTEKELLGKPHSIVRHPDMPASAFKDMWNTIQSGNLWVGEVKNLTKNGEYYWVQAHIAPYYNGDGKHIGYSAIRLDITSRKNVEKLNAKMTNLLDNIGQGFLIFDKDLKIDESFSKECLKIFQNENITNRNISELLFFNDDIKKDLFEDGISRILLSDNIMEKELFLSLLPKEQFVNMSNIQIEYKLLSNDKFMLILTDITQKKKLEYKIIEQNKIQNMIVSVAANKSDFIQIKQEFEEFISSPTTDFDIFKRNLHTFKGIFAQTNMVHVVDGIHKLETLIKENNNISHIEVMKKQYDLEAIFKKDLEIIYDILGENVLEYEDNISINKQLFNELETKIIELEKDNPLVGFSNIVKDFQKINYTSIYQMLKPYVLLVKQMSIKLDKLIKPLEINGDKNIIVNPSIKPFVSSLIHIFNNCIEHGIEDIDTRIMLDKDESGSIVCSFKIIEDKLEISISDDGSGIDIEKLIAHIITNNLKTQEEIDMISEEEKILLIFEDNITTKDVATLTSGRGVGMSAIRYEIDKLYGSIKIENTLQKGIKFIFTIPL